MFKIKDLFNFKNKSKLSFSSNINSSKVNNNGAISLKNSNILNNHQLCKHKNIPLQNCKISINNDIEVAPAFIKVDKMISLKIVKNI